MKLTLNMLRELDCCGEYLRRFGRAFPESEYPNGVDINQENCAAQAAQFDWSWAIERMLTYDGQRVVLQLRQSRKHEYRRFGTGTERRAAVFGHVFDTMPEHRSERIITAAKTADERADERLLRDLREMQHNVQHAASQIDYWQRHQGIYEKSVVELQERTVGIELRQAERRARQMKEEIEEAQGRVTRLRNEAEEADKKLAELTAAAEAKVDAAAAIATPVDETTPTVKENAAALQVV